MEMNDFLRALASLMDEYEVSFDTLNGITIISLEDEDIEIEESVISHKTISNLLRKRSN
jgi:hypothetical protein